jgi:tetratricopeptide (TPR) repeat protein
MPVLLTDLALERLRRLPQRDDVFELAVVRMPRWVLDESSEGAYRPLIALACSRREGTLADGEMIRPAELPRHNPLEAISRLASHRSTGYRPTTVAVRDAALVEPLRVQLAPFGVSVQLTDTLPLIDEIEADMTREFTGGEADPGYLDQPGVTLERVRAFAEGAAAFHRAKLWWHLGDYDVVCVESPVPARELSCVVVLSGGDGELGLAFFDSVAEHTAFAAEAVGGRTALRRPRWSCTFDGPYELPNADSELWEQHSLPVAEAQAYPMLACFAPERDIKRPDAATLVHVEGLLRALAATTEEDLDSGRWRKTVSTFEGEREYVFALPGVLVPSPQRPRMPDPRSTEHVLLDLQAAVALQDFAEPSQIDAFVASLGGRVPHVPAAAPREHAAEKYREALDAQDRRRIKLAREAIALWPDFADAWVLLAEDMPDTARALELWRHALGAATRDLGPDVFRDRIGHFWDVLETRPYMRALLGLAHIEYERAEDEASVSHSLELLRLDAMDHLGVRLFLVPRLLVLNRDAAAEHVLANFPDDPSAILAFARALLVFRRASASPEADAALTVATKSNRHALKYLMGGTAPSLRDHEFVYSPGDEREARIIAYELFDAFEDSPGAEAWLRAHRRAGKKSRASGKPKG